MKVNISPNILIWLILQHNIAVLRPQVLKETWARHLRTEGDYIEVKEYNIALFPLSFQRNSDTVFSTGKSFCINTLRIEFLCLTTKLFT